MTFLYNHYRGKQKMEILELKQILKSKKITYKELSEKSNIPEGTIKNIMRGAVPSPGLKIMNALYKAVGIDEKPNNEVESYLMSKREIDLLNNFRLLSDTEQEMILQMIQGLTANKANKVKNA